jgi:CubicO group peptidase (beta-lactamase class C family)
MLRHLRVLAIFLLLAPPSIRAQEGPLKGLDDYILKSMKDWDIPGLAIAVVKDDKVVLAKGYGVRKLGDTTPVDANTLFAIASNSKAFTAATLAMLVDEGKVGWDDPIIKHIPGFQMYDPYAARELTIRDTLCHRSGLERHDLLWLSHPEYSRDEVLRRIQFIKPSWSFRSKYGYQNLMFLVAGQVVPAVTGKSWDDFAKERIITPLGMKRTSTSITRLEKDDNVASPHQRVDGKVQAISYRNVDNVGPAGSINSCVAEMSQWLRLQLAGGVYDKKRLLSAKAIAEMHKPQMVVPREETILKLLPDSHFMAYGLGLMMLDHRGRKVIQHGGSLPGMISQVFLVPEEKLGVVVLTNFRFNSVPMSLPYRILDAYMGGETKDWTGEALKIWKTIEKRTIDAELKELKKRVEGTKPSLALEAYTGTYKDDLYGELKVTLEKDKLVLRFGPAFTGTLNHWHYDTFRTFWDDRTMGKAMITFTLNADGRVSELALASTSGKLTMKKVMK